jgi:hypothetical protein
MLEPPKALSTRKLKIFSENLKDVTMDNQQETKSLLKPNLSNNQD